MTEAEKQALTQKLIEAAKKEIRLGYHRSDDRLDMTASKIGGRPAVPVGFEWPTYTGTVCGDSDREKKTRPLSFLAQIRLKDVKCHDEEDLLPESGIISFFYDLETMTWGFDPEDKSSARVYYFPEDTDLTYGDIPEALDEEYIIPELAVTFTPHTSLPGYGDKDDEPGISRNADLDWDEYMECRESAGGDDIEDLTKLLGYPNVIQNPTMEEECEACSRGFRQGNEQDFAAVSAEDKEDIARKAKDWMLLFQMSTVETDDFELMFGDCGSIYFWIRKGDLKERRFDKVWLVLQCF
ncbi:MAG: DUF1963 domain-containing protein [Oscillospiraceae bacterium]|nr:DUF1963 domain-containing protein [Oscillospiraceae bacterium]